MEDQTQFHLERLRKEDKEVENLTISSGRDHHLQEVSAALSA
jgi:hypothetical protein